MSILTAPPGGKATGPTVGETRMVVPDVSWRV